MIKIDCFGDVCPVPLLKLKAALKKSSSGDEIQLVIDHSCVLGSIEEYYDDTNHLIDIVEPLNGVWEIYITKNYYLSNPKPITK